MNGGNDAVTVAEGWLTSGVGRIVLAVRPVPGLEPLTVTMVCTHPTISIFHPSFQLRRQICSGSLVAAAFPGKQINPKDDITSSPCTLK